MVSYDNRFFFILSAFILNCFTLNKRASALLFCLLLYLFFRNDKCAITHIHLNCNAFFSLIKSEKSLNQPFKSFLCIKSFAYIVFYQDNNVIPAKLSLTCVFQCILKYFQRLKSLSIKKTTYILSSVIINNQK